MPKTAPRAAERASKKRGSARPPAKKATPAKRPVKVKTASAPQDTEALVAALSKALRLRPEEVLSRAVNAFAIAHGQLAAPVPAPAPVVETSAAAVTEAAPKVESAPARAEKVDDSQFPALAPEVRLYVHGNGRPPQEMIADTYFIGSSPKCDLWVNMPKIETRHLRIVREGKQYFAEDLDTNAGTVFNGEPIRGRHELKHEDTLWLAGYHKVRFYLLS